MRTGECGCGNIKIRTNGEPEFRLMCHCKSCQKRTGSDYSHNVYFSHEQVEIFGEVKPYTRTAQEDRYLTNYFCPECGMTLYWHMDVSPKITGIAISVFDVDDFEMPEESIWEKFKRPWVEFDLQLKHLPGQSG
jgi:hypothetical protein